MYINLLRLHDCGRWALTGRILSLVLSLCRYFHWRPGWFDWACSPSVTEHWGNLGKHSALQMKEALLLWTRQSVREGQREHSFRMGGCWGGRRGALLRPLHRRSLVMVPEGELCTYADVFVALHHSCEASRPDLRHCTISQTHFHMCSFSDVPVQHLLSAQVCWDSRIWARDQELHHPSPRLRNLQVTVILNVWNKTVTETLTELFNVMSLQHFKHSIPQSFKTVGED